MKEPGTVLSVEEALEHSKWLAIDSDGTAMSFTHEPVKIEGKWVPDKFPTEFKAACYRVDAEYPTRLHGKKLRRKAGEFIPA